MLSNAYFVAKFRFDTAENEPAKNLQILQIKMQKSPSKLLAAPGLGLLPLLLLLAALLLGEPRGLGPRRLLPRRLRYRRLFLRLKMDVILEGIFANFWRARYRLYQNEILQENMRLTAFFKLYKMCTLLHRSKLNILTKNRWWKGGCLVPGERGRYPLRNALFFSTASRMLRNFEFR